MITEMKLKLRLLAQAITSQRDINQVTRNKLQEQRKVLATSLEIL